MYKQVAPNYSAASAKDEWLTPKEICTLLQIPEQTFYQWRSRGVGPHAYRIGKHLRISQTDFEAWLSLRSDPE